MKKKRNTLSVKFVRKLFIKILQRNTNHYNAVSTGSKADLLQCEFKCKLIYVLIAKHLPE